MKRSQRLVVERGGGEGTGTKGGGGTRVVKGRAALLTNCGPHPPIGDVHILHPRILVVLCDGGCLWNTRRAGEPVREGVGVGWEG